MGRLKIAVVLAGLLGASSVAAQGLQNKIQSADQARLVRMIGVTQLGMNLISDDTPESEMTMFYRLRVQGALAKNVSGFMFGGFNHNFVAVGSQDEFELANTSLGVIWKTPIKIKSYTLGLQHELIVSLPTSRLSRVQDLRMAPMFRIRAVAPIVGGLVATVLPHFRYRWHRFAERSGTQGGLLTQFDTGIRGGLDYSLFGVNIGASTAVTGMQRYASIDDHSSATSDQSPLRTVVSWEAHMNYSPLSFLVAGISVEQGNTLLQQGIVDFDFFDREETQLAFTLVGIY